MSTTAAGLTGLCHTRTVRWFAVAAVASLTATAAPAAPAHAERAHVVVVHRTPAVVRGTQFKPAESVTVRLVVRAGPRVSKIVRAGARGGWVVRFPAVELPVCGSFVVRATGSRGSTASYTEHLPPCGAAP